MCDQLGTRPIETVYVGDNYAHDVEGAEEAGLPFGVLGPPQRRNRRLPTPHQHPQGPARGRRKPPSPELRHGSGADEDAYLCGGPESVFLVKAGCLAGVSRQQIPTTDAGKNLAEPLEQLSAVALTLQVLPYAQLLKEEMVAIAVPFAMTEREADDLPVQISDTDTCGARTGEEVTEPLQCIRWRPILIPGRGVECFDVEIDTPRQPLISQENRHGLSLPSSRSAAHRCDLSSVRDNRS